MTTTKSEDGIAIGREEFVKGKGRDLFTLSVVKIER